MRFSTSPSSGVVATLAASYATTSSSPACSTSPFATSHACSTCPSPSYGQLPLFAVTVISSALARTVSVPFTTVTA